MKKLLKNWYKASPNALKWFPAMAGLHLEARKGTQDGKPHIFLYDDGMPLWECNEGFFFAHFYQVNCSGKSLKLIA